MGETAPACGAQLDHLDGEHPAHRSQGGLRWQPLRLPVPQRRRGRFLDQALARVQRDLVSGLDSKLTTPRKVPQPSQFRASPPGGDRPPMLWPATWWRRIKEGVVSSKAHLARQVGVSGAASPRSRARPVSARLCRHKGRSRQSETGTGRYRVSTFSMR